MIKVLSHIKKTLVAVISALIGAIAFYAFAMGLLFVLRFFITVNHAEATPPLWIWLFVIVLLFGMVLSAVFAGFFGYYRYRKTPNHPPSETPEGTPKFKL